MVALMGLQAVVRGNVIRLSGEVDMAVRGELEELIDSTIADALLFDLEDVTFIDSSGVAALFHSVVPFTVIAASDPVRRVFEILGLRHYIVE